MLSIVVWNPSDISDLLFLSLIDLPNWMTYHPTTWMVRQHFNIPSTHFFFVCRFWVIRSLYGSVIPSTLWTRKIVPPLWVIRPLRGGYTVHFYGLIKLFPVLGDPSTSWRQYRPLYGLLRLFPVFGWSVHFVAAIPSTLWTCKIVHFFGWSVHFVAAVPSTLWTCKILPRFGVIRPLCGGYIVRFVDL